MDVLQLLLERKINEVEKLIKETEEKISDLAENISQAKVSSSQKSDRKSSHMQANPGLFHRSAGRIVLSYSQNVIYKNVQVFLINSVIHCVLLITMLVVYQLCISLCIFRSFVPFQIKIFFSAPVIKAK